MCSGLCLILVTIRWCDVGIAAVRGKADAWEEVEVEVEVDGWALRRVSLAPQYSIEGLLLFDLNKFYNQKRFHCPETRLDSSCEPCFASRQTTL